MFSENRDICDAIKQNESELEKNKNTDFSFSVGLNNRAIFCRKPDENWTYGSRDIAISVILKTMQYKEN